VSLVKAERLPDRLPRGFFPGAPDLAVEVVSPGDTAAYLESKIQDYLGGGAQRVWVVYPDTRSVVVHQPNGTARRYGADDTLTDEELLPGFSLPLEELFI
jgi:Uma2 family endonuclease